MRLFIFFFLFFQLLITQAQPPAPRHLEEIAFDEGRNKFLLFGGTGSYTGGWKEPPGIHEWDGKKWIRHEAAGPVGRRGHGWVYDEDSKTTWLIGGVTKGRTVEDSLIFDVWSWNDGKWKMWPAACPVKEPEVVYDTRKKAIMVYGEAAEKHSNKENEKAFELWQVAKGVWKKLSSDGPDITGSRAIGFDRQRNRLVIPVFSENKLVVWEWNSVSWKQIPCETPCPAYRTRFAFYYYPGEGCFLFGGLSASREQLGDFWQWNGKEWKLIVTGDGPGVRNSAHFVYGNKQLYLYGGSVPKAPPEKGIELSNELWAWKKEGWKRLR